MSWLVVCAKPNLEKRAAESFKREGWNYYLPMVLEPRFRSPRPFFPRYLFLEEGNFDPIDARYSVGVSDVLRSAKNSPFSRVNGTIIQELKDREQDGVIRIDLPPSPWRGIQPDTPVRVGLEGRQLVGEFIAMPAPDRVLVLLSILGAGRVVEVPVEKASVQVGKVVSKGFQP